MAILLPAVAAFVILDGDALYGHDYWIQVRGRRRQPTPRPASTRSPHCGRRSKARSCSGRLILGIYIVATGYGFRRARDRPTWRGPRSCSTSVRAVLLRLDGHDREPVARTTSGFMQLNGRAPTRCCRTIRSSPSTHRCSTRATWASRCPFSPRSPRSSPAASVRAGSPTTRRGSLIALELPAPSGSSSARGGATRCSVGAATGLGPGRERVALAVAHGDRVLALGDGAGTPGDVRVWNLSLIISTFALTILGTFLTRSGVIGSVHAFTQSSWARAARLLRGGDRTGLVLDRLARRPAALTRAHRLVCCRGNRAFLANNLLFTGFAFVVFTGTVFPLLVETLENKQISVGSPYFNTCSCRSASRCSSSMAVAADLAVARGERRGAPQPLARAAVCRRGRDGARRRLRLGWARRGRASRTGSRRSPPRASRATSWWRCAPAGRRLHEPVPEGGLSGTVRGNPRRWGGLHCAPRCGRHRRGPRGRREGTRRAVRCSSGPRPVGHRRAGQRSPTSGSFGHAVGGEGHPRTHASRSTDGAVRCSASTRPRSPPTPSVTQGIGYAVRCTSACCRDDYLSLESPRPAMTAVGSRCRSSYRDPLVSWIWIGGLVMALGTILCLVPEAVPASLAIVGQRNAAMCGAAGPNDRPPAEGHRGHPVASTGRLASAGSGSRSSRWW